jgi:hypothetical protein
MTDIRPGTVIMEAGTLLPNSLGIEADPLVGRWELIKDSDGRSLEQKIRKAGWSFFFLAENLQVAVCGFWGGRVPERAIKRLLKQTKSSKFNCLEITEISARKFLGIPYVHISAHSRHVQKGSVLQSLAERSRTGAAAAWAIA